MPVGTKEETLTATECAVLGLLTRGPMSGYDLKKAIDGSVGYFWGPAKSQIYAVLPRLVEAGYATSRKVAQSQRPDKQVYRITALGREALRRWIEDTPTPPEPDRNTLLLKLFFGEVSSPDVLAEHVRERRESAQRLKDELEVIDAAPHDAELDFYSNLTRRYGHRWADAVIAWADEAERELVKRSDS
ncbi:MAG TPA: PadR family transcriptional regulator [Gaiellaceae bacterium]|jgi:DNA-binding PadR family transcriptional regulator|nr:PadR family transcriptional regulator [Gaiellaceae bacterium]